MFLSRRVVPQTPPSLVKLSSRARCVMTGAATSVPSSDQVPELRNAALPWVATAATAEPVSWQAGTTTGVPASAGETSARTEPITAPGSKICGSRRVGRPSASNSSVAQLRVRAFMNWVVVALVYSAPRVPVSQ